MESLSMLDHRCSALAGMFQLIVNESKGGKPLWDDFILRTSKLHGALKSTLSMFASFLDAFQKIADIATNAQGATKDIGATLTRLIFRQKTIEAKVRELTNSLMDSLVVPLQEKLDEWQKVNRNMDREHTRGFKKAHLDIKKRTELAVRLKKKAASGASKKNEIDKALDTAVKDLVSRYAIVEEIEKRSLRTALIEERSRYCTFVGALTPVLENEVNLVSELNHLQEVIFQLDKNSQEPSVLPAHSEQVLIDLLNGDSVDKWSWQTPPSSPSSLDSRKSSMCSITSVSSSEESVKSCSISQSPRPKFKSGSQTSIQSETLGSPVTTSSAPAASSWPNMVQVDSSLRNKSMSAMGLHQISERPHTISGTYEKFHDRPSLSVYTFHPPMDLGNPLRVSSQPCSPVCLELKPKPPLPMRCSSLERPTVPAKKSSYRILQMQHRQQLEQQPLPPPIQPEINEEIYQNLMDTKMPPPPISNWMCKNDDEGCESEQLKLERTLKQKEEEIRLLELELKRQKMESLNISDIVEEQAIPNFNQAAPDMVIPQPFYCDMSDIEKVSDKGDESLANSEKNDDQGSDIQNGLNQNLPGQDECAIYKDSIQSSPGEGVPNLSRKGSDNGLSIRSLGSSGYGSQPNIMIEMNNQSEAGSRLRCGSLRRGIKPPPPIRRTSSISSTSSLIGNALSCSVSASASNSSINSSTYPLVSSPMSDQSASASSEIISSKNVMDGKVSDSSIHMEGHTSFGSGFLNSQFHVGLSTQPSSLENLPPPPAFLMNADKTPELSSLRKVKEEFIDRVNESDKICDTPKTAIDETIKLRRTSVLETVKSLQKVQHQPKSPVTHRRSNSFRNSNKEDNESPRKIYESGLERKLSSGSVPLLSHAVIGSAMENNQVAGVKSTSSNDKISTFTGQRLSLSPKLPRQRLTSVQELPSSHVGDGHDGIYGTIGRQLKGHSSQAGVSKPTYVVDSYGNPTAQLRKSSFDSGSLRMRNDFAVRKTSFDGGITPPVVPAKPVGNQPSFLKNLNKVLSQRQSINGGRSPPIQPDQPLCLSAKGKGKRHSGVDERNSSLQRSGSSASEKAAKVRNWINSIKASSTNSTGIRESLLDQIKRGTTLRRPNHVRDRSAPRVY